MGRVLGLVVVVAALVWWWWWPTLARDPDRLDVLVIGIGEVRDASQSIERRIREEGMSVEVALVDPCRRPGEAARMITDRSPAVVVVSPQEPCAWRAVLPVLDDARAGAGLLVLAQTAAIDDDARRSLETDGVRIVDPSRLLGPPDATRVPCLWWDDCDADGLVAVREPDGTITGAGAERIARVLTGNIA